MSTLSNTVSSQRSLHERRRVLLVGDSITQQSFSAAYQGWGAGLGDWYQRSADVMNRGFSGYNSRWMRQSLQQMFPPSAEYNQDVILVTLFLGANDAACAPSPQHVPLIEYQNNMTFILDYLRSTFTSATFVLITPPQVSNELWPTRSIATTSEYAKVIRKLGERMGVSVLDLWENGLCRVELSDLRDGLHLGVDGNKKVLLGLQSLIKSNFPQLSPEDTAAGVPNLSYHFPQHAVLGASTDESASQLILQNWKW